METDDDIEKEFPGWITQNRKRWLYELILYKKYKRWFPLWFVKMYLMCKYFLSKF